MLRTAMAVVDDRKTRLTYEDYLQFPEDGRRHGEPAEVDLREVW